MSFGIQTLKRIARSKGVYASDRTIVDVVARVEHIQAQFFDPDNPTTEEDLISLGLRFLGHSDTTGEMACGFIKNPYKAQAA